jgi:hypothetical protein
MAKIKIKDLPEDAKVSEEELSRVKGGMAGNAPGDGPLGKPSGIVVETGGKGSRDPVHMGCGLPAAASPRKW